MLLDRRSRPLRNLRLSVTDRCNLRCQYCMPEDSYRWLPREDILCFAEIVRLVDVFGALGVHKVRLTGGEPLLRRDLPLLVRMIAARPTVRELALTTNGLLLADAARDLKDAGLDRITVSLDTLRRERFLALARRDELARTLAGIDAARAAGFSGTKLDTVVMRGHNDDELPDLLAFARDQDLEIRFIEYMDVAGATGWSMQRVMSRTSMLEHIEAARGRATPVPPASDEERSAPADRYVLQDGQVFGIIASTTAPFCGACDRSRLTADGMWYLCLYARLGIDLKALLRAGASDAELAASIARSWTARDDRGAEQRAGLAERGRSHEVAELRDDPRLEMHTRGG